ncbi:SagB/ThcOx family dehydrogenase [Myxococcota bacterium]|nr:SagB/ThcOx family dehydrogenase [Myxococcota bacterium]MBU1508848.1 SagB/ThcOx family dehydrogenase [Myxococcota bacterium]
MTENVFSLPECTHQGMPLEEALRRRRSVRRFSDRSMTPAQLGQLLFAAQGQVPDDKGRPLRTAPSAGGTYPMELVVYVRQVDGVPTGIHRYLPEVHGLRLCAAGDLTKTLMESCLFQPWVARAQVVVFITGVPERIRPRYGDRSGQYIFLEAGHIAQNLLLQATSLGLAAVPVGAFTEERLQEVLHLDRAWETVVDAIPVGTV